MRQFGKSLLASRPVWLLTWILGVLLTLCTSHHGVFAQALSPADSKALSSASLTAEGAGKADTAWMIVASALVMLMTPGLAFFYGGLARAKNVFNTLMMSFVALALISVQWVLWGYSVAFGPADVHGLFASPATWAGLREGTGATPVPNAPAIPGAVSKSDHLNKQKAQEELLFLMAKMKTAFRRAGVAVEGHQKLQQRPKQD